MGTTGKTFLQGTAFCPQAFCNTGFQILWNWLGDGRRKASELRKRLLEEDESILSIIMGFVTR